jgi:hypothetical protein
MLRVDRQSKASPMRDYQLKGRDVMECSCSRAIVERIHTGDLGRDEKVKSGTKSETDKQREGGTNVNKCIVNIIPNPMIEFMRLIKGWHESKTCQLLTRD